MSPVMDTSTAPRPVPAPDNPADGDDTRPRITLSLTQVLASALAAITATVSASYLGVAGTVIGAAVASVLTVVGNAVYGLSLQRTGERVRTAVPGARRVAGRRTAPVQPPPRRSLPGGRPNTWKVLAAASVGVFVSVLLLVTAVELVAGRPLSDLVRGKQGGGTSVLGTVGGGTSRFVPTAPVTVTVTPTVVTATPTVTVTGDPVTSTATPTTTTTPPAAQTPTPTPTSSASASDPATSPAASGTSSTAAPSTAP